MRFPIAAKVVLLFSTLTLMTLGLGITSYYSYNAYSVSAGRMMALKDFSLHLERLDAMTARIYTDCSALNRKAILDELDLVNKRIDNMPDLDFKHSPETARRFADLPRAFDSFRQAVLALLAQHERHRILPELDHSVARNQKIFLNESSQRFFNLVNDGIRILQSENMKRQARYKTVLIAGNIFALCFNLCMWLIISRYFNRFLKTQKSAIHAIESGNYDYDFPAPSNDEIGDLSFGMKELAQNLSRARKGFSNIFQQAADAIVILDMDGNVIDVNSECCRMVDYTREELLGMKAYQVDAGLSESGSQILESTFLVPGKSMAFHRSFVRKNGTLFPVELKLTLIETRVYDRMEGRITVPQNRLYLVFARDISGRQKAEKKLRESEEKYRSMMETMNDPVYICSSGYRVEYMNPAMIRRIGKDGTGQNCYQVIHGLDDICPWCDWKNGQLSGDSTKDLISPLDDRSYHVSASPIVISDKTRLKLSIYRDVTDLKRLENQLIHAQKMEAIGTLAGGIAHDFNNILFPIMGNTEMLLQDAPKDSDLHKGLEKIYMGAERARDLVSRILAFSRQDRGQVKLMDVGPVIDEALKLLRASIPATIDINTSISPDCSQVMADPIQIHQMIMNLATNAFHAMEEYGGVMTISLEQELIDEALQQTVGIPKGVYNLLTVADTGCGMDGDLQEKIFNPYFTTKGQGKGTGMGLAVVHGIITRMGGNIDVITTPGKGSVFRLHIPAINSQEEKSLPVRKNSTNALDIAALAGGNEHILVLDDEPDVMVIQKRMLERFGYQVTGMTDSRAALKAFKENPNRFKLVITDIAMPKMSGGQFAVELRNIRPDLPVLFCTGFAHKILPDLPGSAELTGRLLKPLDVRQMMDAVRCILDRAVTMS